MFHTQSRNSKIATPFRSTNLTGRKVDFLSTNDPKCQLRKKSILCSSGSIIYFLPFLPLCSTFSLRHRRQIATLIEFLLLIGFLRDIWIVFSLHKMAAGKRGNADFCLAGMIVQPKFRILLFPPLRRINVTLAFRESLYFACVFSRKVRVCECIRRKKKEENW